MTGPVADLRRPLSVDGPVVVLGLMGTGKTTVARLLADRLGRPLRDSDDDILTAEHRTAAEISATDGADALHDIEARHLLDALAERPPVVVAAAASTVERADCRAALRAATVVWLDAATAVLVGRFAGGAYRPRFGPDLAVMLTGQDRRRRPLFTEVADIHLDTGAATPDQVAARVLADLHPAAAPDSVGQMVNPIQLQKYLKGIGYPAKKDDVVEYAKSHGADDEAVDALSAMKDGQYDTPASISHAISEAGKT